MGAFVSAVTSRPFRTPELVAPGAASEAVRAVILANVDLCRTVADRVYLLKTLRGFPRFSIVLDELLGDGTLKLHIRKQRPRDSRGFAYGEPVVSGVGIYRVPSPRTAQ
jgi:hypothetical protein